MDRPGAKAHNYVRFLALALGFIALALILASGPGTRSGWWGWPVGLGMMKWSFYVGAAAVVSGVALLLLHAFPSYRSHLWIPVSAIVCGLAATIPPYYLLHVARSVPPIHDVTTDTADPPAFVFLLEARRKSDNGFAYGGDAIAAQQQKAYPDIKPLILKAPPKDAVQAAIDAARSLGWEVMASDAPAGRIEATDTTSWFGFKDDVVIRVRPEGAGSRVDVRSVSRVGESDLGANASRVRKFLSKMS